MTVKDGAVDPEASRAVEELKKNLLAFTPESWQAGHLVEDFQI